MRCIADFFVFSLSTTDGVDMSTVELLPDTSEFAARVHAVVTALRQERPERSVFSLQLVVFGVLSICSYL